MDIYADIVLLVNTAMNSFVLWATAKLTRHSPRLPWMLLGGGCMAGLYLAVFIFLPFSRALSIAASVLLLAAGIFVALRPKTARAFIRCMLTGYFCAFVLGGIGMRLYYASGLPGAWAAAPNVPWLLPAACILLAYVFIKLGLRVVERITVKKQALCSVTIFMGTRDVSLNALVDTGHTLHEPLSKLPVIIAEYESLAPLLADEQQLNTRMRAIPFVSLGCADGMLLGFRPDRVRLNTKETKDVIIGIYNRKLCGNGRYQGLIGPALVA